MVDVSVDPLGKEHRLPESDAQKEQERLLLEAFVAKAMNEEKTLVVVMGVGFVGAAMAAVVAENPRYAVIGYQRPSTRSYWKVPWIREGRCPVESEDPDLARLISIGVAEGRLTATAHPWAIEMADIIVVDVQCDYRKNELGDCRDGEANLAPFENAMRLVGRRMARDALVLVETTVPPGTTEYVAWPILKKEFEKRPLAWQKTTPLLAHSYERVMPGRDYVASIRDYWRVVAGCTTEATAQTVSFLTSVLNTAKFPLTVLDRPLESETAKVIENSFRAVTLAFMDEWSTFCERAEVDMVKVIDAIRARPTHANLLFPGPGIGGYCLPKDGPLGMWAYKHLLGFEDGDRLFKITPAAIDINDRRGLHAAELVRDALRSLGRYVASSKVLVAGASYRQDVGDTRWSGSELIVRKLTEMGAEVTVTDPYVREWHEFTEQSSYPVNWMHRARFFRNQKALRELEVEPDVEVAVRDIDALVLAVPHRDYFTGKLEPGATVRRAQRPIAVVDCFGILDDTDIESFMELGCEVRCMGRGHVERLRRSINK